MPTPRSVVVSVHGGNPFLKKAVFPGPPFAKTFHGFFIDLGKGFSKKCVKSFEEGARGRNFSPEKCLPRECLPFFFAALGAVAGCSEPEVALRVELVPNPEVNTSEQVAALVNSLDVVLDADGGFDSLDAGEGDTWGSYLVTDFDGDGVLELVLTRRGDVALEPFGLTAGHQGSRSIRITARGIDTNRHLAALGGSWGELEDGSTNTCQVPFNLLPDRRPLRVVSMSPPSGSRSLEAPLEDVTIQLGSEVRLEAIEGNLLLRAESVGVELVPSVEVSYIDTGMGRLTNIRFRNCPLPPGEYVLVVSTELCTPTGQCLDQHLGLEGEQPFEGSLHVAGTPEVPSCEGVTMMALACPEQACPEGYTCELGSCVPAIEVGGTTEEECSEDLCIPPAWVCDGIQCVPDCRLYGACAQPEQSCDADAGICR
jgi:hypothetical protein